MIKRTIEKYIVESLDLYPVIVITGPRQVGKSTLVYSLKDTYGFNYVSLDDIDNRRQAIEDPKLFIQFHGYPLIIDEVQYAPGLLEVIESISNQARLNDSKSTGLFILTGSHAFNLMQNVSQSLAGRATIITMNPLSVNEINGKHEEPFHVSVDLLKKKFEYKDVNQIFKEIHKGYYPELFNQRKHSIEKYYSDYIKTYIDRDITEIINVKDSLKFHNFMQILASLTGQELNYNSISKSVEVDAKTIKSWVSVLETSGLIHLLQPYNDRSINKRVVRSAKIYFSDTGLASHLLRIKDSETLLASNFAGAYMETMVINEIRKSYLNNNKDFNAYYYRDNNQNEIDLILLENAEIKMIEVKKGVSFSLSDVSSFKQLAMSQYKIGYSCIICNTEMNYPISRDVGVISVNSI
jgi:hypothetical protein